MFDVRKSAGLMGGASMKSTKKKNVVVIDNHLEDVEDFMNGLRTSTKCDWDVLVRTSNDRSSRLANAIRYFKYFFVGCELFFHRNQCNIIIAYQQFYGLILAMLCRIFRVKKQFALVVMTVIYKDKRGGALRRLYKKFYEYAIQSEYIDAMTCVTTVECVNYSQIFNIPPEKFHYIKWGVKDHSIGYRCSSNEKKYIFSAGRSNRDWEFVFETIGGSKYNAVVVGAELDYQNRFDNIDVLSNIPDGEYYTALAEAYCVFLSIKDVTISAGQITLIQAMQFGKPIVLTQSDGLTNDYVVHGENGLIVEKDREAVLKALELLYTDERLYKKLSINARKTYEGNLSSRRVGIDLGEMLAELSIDCR